MYLAKKRGVMLDCIDIHKDGKCYKFHQYNLKTRKWVLIGDKYETLDEIKKSF